MKTKQEQHKARQRKDGSIYCKCNALVNQKENAMVYVMVSLIDGKKELMCSVCGEVVKE